MLPKEFDLNNLDNGIKELVITLNKIPDINKKTTIYGPTSCEGHLYEYDNKKPHSTKDGWLYFYKPTLKRGNLIEKINQFCKEYPYFSIDSGSKMEEYDITLLGLKPKQGENFICYSLEGTFWMDSGYESNFRFLDENKKLIEKAILRKKELLEGWKELDLRLNEYIMQNITKDIQSLPYINEEDNPEEEIIPFCPHC